tara:strand:+ start:64 stop:534 length:471 start_codon:yes stop_codon:yes gene_type:complete
MTLKREIDPFAIIPRWVLLSDITPGAVRTYCVLNDMAGKDKPAFPSHRYLANLCNCSRASVKRYIEELVEIGAIRVQHRTRIDNKGQSSNYYWVMHNQEAMPIFNSPKVTDELGVQVTSELHNNNQNEQELNIKESKKHLQEARANLKKNRLKQHG